MNKNESNNRLQLSEKQRKKAKDKIANMALSAAKSSPFSEPKASISSNEPSNTKVKDSSNNTFNTNYIDLNNSSENFNNANDSYGSNSYNQNPDYSNSSANSKNNTYKDSSREIYYDAIDNSSNDSYNDSSKQIYYKPYNNSSENNYNDSSKENYYNESYNSPNENYNTYTNSPNENYDDDYTEQALPPTPKKTVKQSKTTSAKSKATKSTNSRTVNHTKSASNLSSEELQLQQKYARIRRKRKIRLIGNTIVFIGLVLLIILGADTLRQKNELNSKVQAAESLEAEVSSQQGYISELNNTITLLQETTTQPPTISTDSTYANLYPDMIAPEATSTAEETHKVYLTFDDGPSDFTPQILDILDQYDIKATFFVVHKSGDKFAQYYKDIVNRGHTIGIHSYTHEYENIYASVENFLNDFQQMRNFVYDTTGVSCSLFRFPGGSKNSFNKDIYLNLINEMERRGFIYYDWNVSSGDAASNTSTEAIINNVCSNVPKKINSVVLMHDANNKSTTVEALPTIIQTLQSQGYTFDKLSYDMTPVQYPR